MNWSIFHEPYPFGNEKRKSIISALFFGTFVSAFLILFQPFGLSNYTSESKFIELIGYGFVTTISLLANELIFTLLFPVWYSKAKWTVGKNILFTLYMFFCIGLANLIYSNLLGLLDLNLKGFVFYQGVTLAIGAIPVSLSTFLVYNKRLKEALKQAEQLNASMNIQKDSNSTTVVIPSKNKKENVEIIVEHLLAVTAVENYVELVFEKDGIQKSMVRNTLKNIEECLSSFHFIKQCHRSHLVNLEKVNHFNGNAQGLNLSFNDFELLVPVSRKFVPSIKSELQKMASQ